MSEKKCPYCKVKIDENALKCNHCHSDLSEKSCEKEGSLFISSDNMFFLKFLGVLLIPFLAYIGISFAEVMEKKAVIDNMHEKALEINELKQESSKKAEKLNSFKEDLSKKAEELNSLIKDLKLLKTSSNQNSEHINNVFGDYIYTLAVNQKNKISKENYEEFTKSLKDCKSNDYFEKGIELTIENDMKWKPVNISNYKCIEVDFLEDYEKMKKIID